MKTGALVILFIGLSACTMPAAQHQWDQEKLLREQSEDARFKSNICVAKEEWACAVYWSQVAQEHEAKANSYQAAGNQAQMTIPNMLRAFANGYAASHARSEARDAAWRQKVEMKQIQDELWRMKK